MQQTLELLKITFPGQNKAYYKILAQGLHDLSEIYEKKNIHLKIGVIHPIDSNHWNTIFKEKEQYIKEIFRIWPDFIMAKVKEGLKKVENFDQCIMVYRDTKFGTFLANTKILVSQHAELAEDWNTCYTSWISQNSRLIHPYVGLSENMTEQGVRLIVNEVILQPDKYHQFPEELKRLIKRQYQLLLTEQNS